MNALHEKYAARIIETRFQVNSENYNKTESPLRQYVGIPAHKMYASFYRSFSFISKINVISFNIA